MDPQELGEFKQYVDRHEAGVDDVTPVLLPSKLNNQYELSYT